MKCLSPQAKEAMSRIFNLVNMSELPALSDNVHELINLIGDDRATAAQLSTVILKDVSLTSKILQVVNSAYYSRGTQVGSVCRAITLIGYNTVREMATSIAIFEDFIKAGGDKEKVTNILIRSYLSGCLAKNICVRNKLHASTEEAFICGLFYNLGELIVLIYLPDLYRKIEEKTATGAGIHDAARAVLDDLTFYHIGMEIAVFWNLCEKIVFSMHPNPPKLRHPSDDFALLMNLSAFCNQLVTEIANDGDRTDKYFKHYDPALHLDRQKVFLMLENIIETSSATNKLIRVGLRQMKLHSKVVTAYQKSRARAKKANLDNESTQ
ncbi:MAG: HDOD domain-containing protein [Desulfobulbaceae bacterium]|nr:HDOD domain-containing protein [Desulfobulbaceae bacterium]